MIYKWLRYIWHGDDSYVYADDSNKRVIKFWERLTPEEVAVYFWLQSRFSEYMQVELDGKIDQLPWNIYLLGNLIRRVNLRVLELHPEHIADSYEELANLDIKNNNGILQCPKGYWYTSCSASAFISWKSLEDIPDTDSRKLLIEQIEWVVSDSDIFRKTPQWLIAPINIKYTAIKGWEIDLFMTDLWATVSDIVSANQAIL